MKKIILTTTFVVCMITFSFGQNSVMDFYNADIQAINSSGMTLLTGKATIRKKDIPNGYISYGLQNLGIKGFKNMAYFTAKNGKKFAVVASFTCRPVCAIQDFNFYELHNGKLVNKSSVYYPSSLKNKVEDALKPYKRDTDKSLWIKIPQQGTIIQFGYQQGGSDGGEEQFVAVCELKYKVSNGTFSFSTLEND